MAKKRREIDRRLETIRELASERSYDRAYEMSEELEPEDLDSVQDMKLVAEIQEKTGHIDAMKRTYLYLFNSTGVRHNLKRFIEVLIRIGEFGEAKVYLKEFEKMDGAVADDFELRYSMAQAQGLHDEAMISLLREFKQEEYMEKWGNKLADLYLKNGMEDEYREELADLKLWFGGTGNPYVNEDDEPLDEIQVVHETSENLNARLEEESETLNEISLQVGEEVSRIADEVSDKLEQREPTLDDMLSSTERQKIVQLEVEDTHAPLEHLEVDEETTYADKDDVDAPITESVSAPKTASGDVVDTKRHSSHEANYLNNMGQAETVGEPVITREPVKARKFEQLFTVDENYEESPPDISDRGIRYWTTTDIIAKLRRKDFEPPHFVLAGGEERITLTMTKRITKELTRLGYHSAQKVMRITAERMNSIRLEEQIDRLIGRCLLITEAAELSKESVHQLMWAMHEFGEEFVVVLSGPFDEIDCFLDIYPELSEQLGYKVRMMY